MFAAETRYSREDIIQERKQYEEIQYFFCFPSHLFRPVTCFWTTSFQHNFNPSLSLKVCIVFPRIISSLKYFLQNLLLINKNFADTLWNLMFAEIRYFKLELFFLTAYLENYSSKIPFRTKGASFFSQRFHLLWHTLCSYWFFSAHKYPLNFISWNPFIYCTRFSKVWIFWEGHKIWKNLCQKVDKDFSKQMWSSPIIQTLNAVGTNQILSAC